MIALSGLIKTVQTHHIKMNQVKGNFVRCLNPGKRKNSLKGMQDGIYSISYTKYISW